MFQSLFLCMVLAALPGPATAPSTQPVSVVITTQNDASTPTVGEAFSNTRFGQLFQGKKKVSLEEVRDPAFWIDSIRDLIVTVLGFIPRIIVAVLFLIFFWVVYRTIKRLVIGSMSKAAVDPSIRDMLGHLIKWSIMGFGIVIACNQIGIQIAA